MGQAKPVSQQIFAAKSPSALILLETTIIILDFDQEVPCTNHTTALGPHFTFHVPVQAVGHIERHLVLTFERGINLP